MKALREAKAWLGGMRETPLTTSGKLLAALVEAVEAAPVAIVNESHKVAMGHVFVPPELIDQRVRVLAVGDNESASA